MKVIPISNNNIQNKSISAKGGMDYSVIELMDNCAKQLKHGAELAESNKSKYPILVKIFNNHYKYAVDYSKNIFQNLSKVMLRFGNTCALKAYTSEKSPLKHVFMIESEFSDYKHLCGEVKFNGDYEHDLMQLDDFTVNNLAKINPYETNLKFKQMFTPKRYSMSPIGITADSFKAQKDIPVIEDALIDAKKGVNPFVNSKVTNEEIENFKREVTEFSKDFNENALKIIRG